MGKWGAVLTKHPWRVIIAATLVVGASVVAAAGTFSSFANGGFVSSESESLRQAAAEVEIFGNHSVDVVAIYSSDEYEATDSRFEAAVRAVVDGVPAEAVTQVITFYDTPLPELISSDGHRTKVWISLEGTDPDERTDAYLLIQDALESETLETNVIGRPVVQQQLADQISVDLQRAELIAFPIVLLLSVFIFRGVVAALMPVLVGGVAVVGAMAAIRGVAAFTEVSVFATDVASMVGMGLAVDYALFIVSRFREELGRSSESGKEAVSAAVQRTMKTAGRTVLFSGLTVAAAVSSLLVFSEPFLRSIGYGGIAATVIAMIAALTVLPATLMLLGHRIDAGRIPSFFGRRRDIPSVGEGGWARFVRGVMRRPVAIVVVTVTVLLGLGLPFLGVQWGSVDYRALPPSAPAHIAGDILATDFGGETSGASLVVQETAPAQVVEYADALARLDGVISARVVAQEGDAALLSVIWEGNSQGAYSQEIVRSIRGVEAPGDAGVLVGGPSAETVDLLDSVGLRLPWMALVMIAVMFVLLFLAFGSLVLPIKAILMNIVSLGASFGVITWIFAEGHFEGPLGFVSTGFLDVTQPIVILAVLFGLSMDYEVFLLSRVREEWDLNADNTRAVAIGLQETGRIITSAAILLAVVIGAFSTSGVTFMKMLGIGILVGLLIDATVIRVLLVPATMKLLDKANWWAPAPLRRWWERHGIRGV